MEDKEKDKLIRSYLQNELSEQDRKELTQATATDPDLRTELLVSSGLYDQYRQDKKNHFKRLVESEGLHPEKPSWPSRLALPTSRRRLFAVAGVACLGFLVYFIFTIIATPDSLEGLLAVQQASVYPVDQSHRGEGPQDLDQDWVNAYQSGDFNRAASILQQLSQNQPASNYYELYLGLAYYYQSAPEKALIPFVSLYREADPTYQDQVRWFLALAYLETGDMEKGRELLEEIIARNGWQREAATQLIKALP